MTTLYNETEHGAWNSTSMLPFYGTAIWDPVYYDTSYAAGRAGNSLPDKWGTYLYDSAFAFAYALTDLIASGGDPMDGAQLLAQLMRTNFEGITGRLQFDPISQDRVAEMDLYNIQSNVRAHVALSNRVSSLLLDDSVSCFPR